MDWWAAYRRWRGRRSSERHKRDAPLTWATVVVLGSLSGLAVPFWPERPWLATIVLAAAFLSSLGAIVAASAWLQRRHPL